METKFWKLFAVAICAFVSSQVQAGVIATWDFDTGGALAGTHNSTYTSTYAVNSHSSPVTSSSKMTTVTLGSQTASQTAGQGVSQSSLTTLTGTALQFNSKNSQSVNGSSFVLSLTTSSSLSGTLVITYDYLASTHTGASAAINTWSLTGASVASITQSGTLTEDGAWHQTAVTFNGFSSSAGTIAFKDLLGGYYNFSSGNNGIAEFDNISFNFTSSQVPEPIVLALPIFGLVVLGGAAGRHFLKAKKLTS